MDSEIQNDNDKEDILIQFKKNKVLVLLLIITLMLGVYLRFDNYAAEGYDSDDTNTIPAAVFAYYPHDYFPGLVSTEPPLGNYIIGLGCMVSGEDFSEVSKVKPLFFPDRSVYIGEAMKNAEKYCFMPNYIFGLIFLIGIIIFAFSFFLDIYSASYFIIFFTFFPVIISSSRIISVNIFLFTFIIFSLIFLWKTYAVKKYLFKEKIYIFISFAFLGLAGATKFTAGALIIFALLLLLEKYNQEILYLLKRNFKFLNIHLLDNNKIPEYINLKNFMINLIIALGSAGFFLMLFFNFSIKNFTDTYHYMTSLNFAGVQAIGFSVSNLYKWFLEFSVKLGVVDLFVFFFSIFILLKIILKKHKTQQEKFALYFVALCIAAVAFLKSGIMISLHHVFPLMWGFFILITLTFSNKEYSVFSIFKIDRKYFLLFLSIYIMISFLTLYFVPFHTQLRNHVVCSLTNSNECKIVLENPRETSSYLESVLNENETFLPTGIYNFYTRHNDDILWWIFFSNFQKQIGKEPRLEDYLTYYKPENRRVRYIHTDPYTTSNPDDMRGMGIDQHILKNNYKPNHIIKLYNYEATYIYDLDNLIKK